MSFVAELATPALLLDEKKLDRNIARMKARLDGFGAPLRPHIKTAKSFEVFRRALPGAVGVTVSTLAEAEYAFESGVRDILYAVGMAPQKLDRAVALRARGAELTLTVDSLEAARAVAERPPSAAGPIPVVVEIDCDGRRAGVPPASASAVDIAALLHQAAGARFRGVMTHAGGSYDCRTADAIRKVAEVERRAVVDTANSLAARNIACEIVSVGSTPTATFAERFDGVTEVRVGVYMFQDLVMAGLGVCQIDDIALSVLASVIGRREEKGWIVIDAGWTALSRDRGTASFPVDQGYGLVCDLEGRPIDDLIVVSCNQEHGIVARRGGGSLDVGRFAVGAKLRILPNHACATAAQFPAYDVIDGARRVARYPRRNGW